MGEVKTPLGCERIHFRDAVECLGLAFKANSMARRNYEDRFLKDRGMQSKHGDTLRASGAQCFDSRTDATERARLLWNNKVH